MAIIVRPPAQIISDVQRDEAQRSLRAQAVPILGTTANLLFNRPAFIARDEDEGPFGNAVKGLTRFNCRRWAAADKVNFSPRVNSGNSEICRPYLESIGEWGGDSILSPVAEGGNCDGTAYAVTFQTQGFGQTSGPITINVTGPFGGMRWVVNQLDNTGQPNSYRLEVNARRWWAPGGNAPSIGVKRWIFYGTLTVDQGTASPTVTIVSVVPLSGSDNCGSPPPLFQPPGVVRPTVTIAPTVNVNIPGLGPVDVTVDFDPDGNPIFCIPALDICTTVKVGGEDPDSDGGVGGGSPPGDVGSPGSPSSTGDGGESEGEAPDGSVLTGLKIDILSTPAGASQYSPGVFRGAAYIYMGVPGLLDQDFGGSMVSDGQFFLAEKDNLTAWRVRANTEYSLRVTPYYREVD